MVSAVRQTRNPLSVSDSTTTVSVTFPDGTTPTISWEAVVGTTSYRVSLYNFSVWNTPEGGSTTYGYTPLLAPRPEQA